MSRSSIKAFPDALTPVSVTVMDAMGPARPETVIFDWALADVLSGTLIGVAFEKTVRSCAGDAAVTLRLFPLSVGTNIAPDERADTAIGSKIRERATRKVRVTVKKPETEYL
jgi:hypothetical protein